MSRARKKGHHDESRNMPRICFANSRLGCKYTQIGRRGTEDKARTIHNPVTFPLIVLSQRLQQQVLLAIRVARGWLVCSRFSFLVLVVDDTPRAIYDALYL